jgi:hypothetical protein
VEKRTTNHKQTQPTVSKQEVTEISACRQTSFDSCDPYHPRTSCSIVMSRSVEIERMSICQSSMTCASFSYILGLHNTTLLWPTRRVDNTACGRWNLGSNGWLLCSLSPHTSVLNLERNSEVVFCCAAKCRRTVLTQLLMA